MGQGIACKTSKALVAQASSLCARTSKMPVSPSRYGGARGIIAEGDPQQHKMDLPKEFFVGLGSPKSLESWYGPVAQPFQAVQD
jgi:hypothetical protein